MALVEVSIVEQRIALSWRVRAASVVLGSGDIPLQPPLGLKLRPWESAIWRRAWSRGPA